MARAPLPEHVQALQRKDSYPRDPGRIQLVQTHLSYVFLGDEEVYKLKKAVDLGFADFTTLEKRRASCEAEVRLNRRGCPGSVYLGVEPLTRERDGYRMGGTGEVVDYAVHMKRLPQDRMMDELLARGEVDFTMIGRVAARLTALHESADRGPQITRMGGFEAFAEDWRQNLEEFRPYVGRTLGQRRFDRLRAYGDAFLAREGPLLREREAEGWVRDCHGDLRSDAVCFDDDVEGGICIYDCIEFNEGFRYIDTGLDAGFLAMDLDYRGRKDLSDLFIGLYAAAIGDKRLPLLLDFFKCYRATVRGKVESLLLDDAGVSQAQKVGARKRARAYFKLAESYATRRRARRAVLVTGPSGTGKSVVAGALAARLGAVLLSTDVIRIEVFGRPSAKVDDRYTEAGRGRVYDAIATQTEAFLAEGRSVVVDGTYLTRARRAPVVAAARRTRASLLVVECTVPDEVVRQRQEQRRSEAWTTSEGTFAVYKEQQTQVQPADEVPQSQRLVLDTTLDVEAQLQAVLSKLRSR